MINPRGWRKQSWDALVALFVVFTAVEVPARLVLQYEAGWLVATDWLVTAVFCIDIVLNFFTPYESRGQTVTDRRRVAFRYLRTWFVIDLLAALPFGAFMSGHHMARAFQLFRLLRLLRLLRLARMMHRWQRAKLINPSVLRLSFFLFWVVLAAHWIACGWIALHGPPPAATGPGLAYVQALYWAVTTMTTVGYGDVTPEMDSATSLIFTMCVMSIGVAIYGYIIGNVAGMLAKLDVARAKHLEKMERINAFMNYRKLPRQLQERILAYHDYLWVKHRGHNETSVTEDLPPSLRTEVALHINRAMIAKVPFFESCEARVIRELVRRMRPVIYGPGDFIVRFGDMGDDMYFIKEGFVDILSEDCGTLYKTLGPGEYFGEIGLLTSKPRTACSRAQGYCELYTLDQRTVVEAMRKYPDFAGHMADEAKARLSEIDAEESIIGIFHERDFSCEEPLDD